MAIRASTTTAARAWPRFSDDVPVSICSRKVLGQTRLDFVQAQVQAAARAEKCIAPHRFDQNRSIAFFRRRCNLGCSRRWGRGFALDRSACGVV